MVNNYKYKGADLYSLFKLKFSKSLFLIVSLFYLVTNSQNFSSGIIEYTIKNSEKFNPNKILNSESVKSLNNQYKNNLMNSMMKTSTFILVFNNNESLYQLKEDKIDLDENKGLLNIKFLELYAGGKSLYYSNLVEKKITVQEKSTILDDELFLIENDFYNWQLTQETKKIGNYLCYKAIKKEKKSKKITIAWYAPELPFSFGPKLYNNLPGLILKVSRGNFVFLASKIEIYKSKNISITKPSKGKKISNEEYTKLISNLGKKIGF